MPPLHPRRGEIYMASMRAAVTARKMRPALIISPDVRNRWASDVLAIPLSTKLRPMRTHIVIDRGEGGLPHTSVVLCEQVMCLHKLLLEGRPLGGLLSEDRMRQVESALLIALGIQAREAQPPSSPARENP